MFRLFLMKKTDEVNMQPQLPTKQLRNRRLYERYNINLKHISMLNEQDILIIRDLSEEGFSCEADTRCLVRMNRGDKYLCKMRYLSEIYEIAAQVMWKDTNFIGFAIKFPGEKVLNFIKRLLNPAQVGYSLKSLDTSLKRLAYDGGPIRFSGEQNSSLVIWETENRDLESWYFECGDKYTQWDCYRGIETGKLLEHQKNPTLSKVWDKNKVRDTKENTSFIQFTIDVLMTLDFPRNQNLIDSLLPKETEKPVFTLNL